MATLLTHREPCWTLLPLLLLLHDCRCWSLVREALGAALLLPLLLLLMALALLLLLLGCMPLVVPSAPLCHHKTQRSHLLKTHQSQRCLG
jgi:hypothetical protein